jgi:hypothetical protein
LHYYSPYFWWIFLLLFNLSRRMNMNMNVNQIKSIASDLKNVLYISPKYAVLQRVVAASMAVGMVLGAPYAAHADEAAHAEYANVKAQAANTYKTARAQCDSLSGQPKDVCVTQAKLEQTRAVEQAYAKYKNTPKARTSARIEIAAAEYNVAKEKCASQSGNQKDVCVEQAKAQKKAAIARAKANRTATEAQQDASDEARQAAYDAAAEKCDALSGADKGACVANAKAQFGQ